MLSSGTDFLRVHTSIRVIPCTRNKFDIHGIPRESFYFSGTVLGSHPLLGGQFSVKVPKKITSLISVLGGPLG